eukprot:CAMPEP_0172652164 /NCGR_PEP_ID=MMETSP1068-20121228/243180_1 /TAXON_ID=35684 /ORGANISM="Pseudopedinella elastica, Strain CCMP716" /LENGTH=397 /DNA_ID=CAMNT_0013466571 /DNA_START=470 /DNA_END=1663 /DNA_ORIENTATION=-
MKRAAEVKTNQEKKKRNADAEMGYGMKRFGVNNFDELPTKSADGSPLGRNAFVTLITQGGCIDDRGSFGYIAGSFALVESIQKTKTKLRIIVAMTSVVVNPRGIADYVEALGAEPAMLRDIEIDALDALGEQRRRKLFNRNRWNGMFTKILLWEQGRNFDKFIYLDTDHMVLHNLDRLIELCQDGVCAVNDSTNPVEKIWDRHYFNAGLMVFKPNEFDFAGLLDAVFNNSLTTGKHGKYDAKAFASKAALGNGTFKHTWVTWRPYSLMEQDLLNFYFITRTTYLAPGYNMWATLLGKMLLPGGFYETQAEVDKFVEPRVHAIHGNLWSPSDGYGHKFTPQLRNMWASFWMDAARKLSQTAAANKNSCTVATKIGACLSCDQKAKTDDERLECWLECS